MPMSVVSAMVMFLLVSPSHSTCLCRDGTTTHATCCPAGSGSCTECTCPADLSSCTARGGAAYIGFSMCRPQYCWCDQAATSVSTGRPYGFSGRGTALILLVEDQRAVLLLQLRPAMWSKHLLSHQTHPPLLRRILRQKRRLPPLPHRRHRPTIRRPRTRPLPTHPRRLRRRSHPPRHRLPHRLPHPLP